MAYNPFDFFRRNQKTFFSVLVVFIMFMFVLSFGQGDFFSWFQNWVAGRKGGSGEVMATLDGSKLYSSELETLQQGRVLANEFMRYSNAAAANNLAESLSQRLSTAGEETKQVLQSLLRVRSQQQFSYVDFQLLRNFPGLDERAFAQARSMTINALDRQFTAVLSTNPPKSPDDPSLAKAGRELMVLDQMITQAAQYGGYFLNLPPSDKPKDMLEFALWLRKADDLGIAISPSDAATLYDKEFLGQVLKKDAAAIERAVYGNRAQVRVSLEEALANEFKVRAAQAVVLGPACGRPNAVEAAAQAFVAPYEGYKFYKEQVVAGTYTILSVPAENYLNNVPGEPTETEVRELFQKYKDKEPSPEVENPGFREPRKLKLGWLEVTGDEPFYTKAAADYLSHAEAAAKAAYAVAGGNGFPALGAVAAANVQDPTLNGAYANYRSQFQLKLDTSWFASSFLIGFQHDVIDTSVVKPATLATAVGMAATALKGTVFTPMLAVSERAKAEDRVARARVFATLFAPVVPGGTNALGTIAAAGARVPDPLPLPVVRTQLADQVRKQAVAQVIQADLVQFATEAGKLGAKKDRTEARAFVDKFAAERKLKVGGSEQPRDRFALDADPGLKPLVEKRGRGHSQTDDVPGEFGRAFFLERDPRGGEVPAKAFFDPQPYPPTGGLAPREGEPTLLAWRTDEVPAETPKALDDKTRPKVVAAWKRLKARELARQTADDLAKTVRETLAKTPGGDQHVVVDQVVRDAHTKLAAGQDGPDEVLRIGFLTERGVAPFPDEPTSTSIGMNRQFEPYSLRASKVIPFPTNAMVKDLVEGKDKPLGTILRFADPAKDRQYVAVLINRNERNSLTYMDDVYKETAFPSQLSGVIRQRERMTAARHAREQALTLLKAEYKVANENTKLSGDKEKGEGG